MQTQLHKAVSSHGEASALGFPPLGGGGATRIVYYYHPDYLGNTEFVTDAGGYPYQFFFYSAFGESLVQQNAFTGGFATPYKFNAKEQDPETGNYYYGARYYNPQTSIWFGVDPLAHNFPGFTPYHFVHNNPIMLIDPTGMCAIDPGEGDPPTMIPYLPPPTPQGMGPHLPPAPFGGMMDEVVVKPETSLNNSSGDQNNNRDLVSLYQGDSYFEVSASVVSGSGQFKLSKALGARISIMEQKLMNLEYNSENGTDNSSYGASNTVTVFGIGLGNGYIGGSYDFVLNGTKHGLGEASGEHKIGIGFFGVFSTEFNFNSSGLKNAYIGVSIEPGAAIIVGGQASFKIGRKWTFQKD